MDVRLLLLAMLVLLFPVSALRSSPESTELTSNCGGPFQLCGYREKDSKIQRIPMVFEIAQPFRDGLAAVRMNGQFGYIDDQGKIIITPRFQDAGPFSGGYAEVRVDGASGIIDRTGRLVVPARFNRIIPFHNGTFIAEPVGKDRPLNSDTDRRLEDFSGLSPFVSFKGAGLYDMRKGWLTDQHLSFDIFDIPERGLVWAGNKNEHSEEIWGLLKSDGTWKVSPRYNHVQTLREGRAVVFSMPDHTLSATLRHESIRWGAVDRNGDLVVPLKFNYLSYWRGGYGYTRKGGQPYNPDGSRRQVPEGIVHSDGSLLAGRYFDEVDIREDGMLPRGRIGSTWHSIEPNGRLVRDQLDSMTLLECTGGLAIVHRGNMIEFRRPIDGKPVGRFDKSYYNPRDCPGPFSAKRRGKWFIVMADGKVLGGAKGFENSYPSSGSHIAVQVDGKWGIIDRSGKFSVKPTFAKLRPDGNGIFAVGERDATYWVDASGKHIAPPVVTKIEPSKALTCEGGLQFFEKAGLWGFRDEAGKTVIAPQFRALSCFSQGVTWTASPSRKAWCPVGPDGARRAEMACRESYYPMTITHHYPEKFSDDPHENSVLWMRAWLDYNAGNRETAPKWISDNIGRGSYSVMEGGAFGPERGTKSGKTPVVIGIIGVLLAIAGLAYWQQKLRT